MFASTPKLKTYSSQQLLHNTLQQKPIQQPLFNDLTPSTPQKFNVVKKILNAPSHPQDSSFRQSNGKRILTQESPQLNNKENIIYKSESQIEIQLKYVMQENKKLSDLLTKLQKEKNDLVNQAKNTDFTLLKQRVERLESVIDSQTDEIEDWKQKYKDVCEQDQKLIVIDQMESQVISVVEENERLNNNQTKMQQQLEQYQKTIKDLEYKLTDQNNQIIAYEEERINLLDKLGGQNKQEQQQQQQTKTVPQNHQEYFMKAENSILELQKSYSSIQFDNENLKKTNTELKNELISMQNAIDELKGNKTTNEKFTELRELLFQLQEKMKI